MNDHLTAREAYVAMLAFLEAHYDRTGADEIGALLGGLVADEDGEPMDPAAWSDWLAAIREAREGRSPGE